MSKFTKFDNEENFIQLNKEALIRNGRVGRIKIDMDIVSVCM